MGEKERENFSVNEPREIKIGDLSEHARVFWHVRFLGEKFELEVDGGFIKRLGKH